MQKRLITTTRKRVLAVLAVIGFMLFSTNPVAAFAVTESTVTIVPNAGAPNSGKLVMDVADEQVHLDLYLIAPGTTAEVRQNDRPLIVLGPMTGFVPPPPFEFNEVAPGTTVKACIRVAATTIVRCDTYVVPGVPAPVDTDKDGVTDDKDQCNDVAGPASNNGCPLPPADADGDGVIDDQDQCKNVAGPASNGGCPLPVDTDKDGVNDDVDNCDNEAGPASNGGCPVVVPEPVDTDKDGVTDDKDQCADVAGPASNNGCPVDVSPKKAAVCKYVGTPGVDERLQTGQNPIVVDRKDWMMIGSPFQDAQGRSIVIAFLNPQDPEPSVDQCPAPEGPPSPKVVTAVDGVFTDLCGDEFNLTFQPANTEGVNYVVVRDGNSLTVHAEVTDAAKYTLANPGWQQAQTDTRTACPIEPVHITLNPPAQEVVCGPNNDVVTPADQPNGVKLVGNPEWVNGKWIVAYSPMGLNVVIDGPRSFELVDAATTCPTPTEPAIVPPVVAPPVVPPAVVVTDVEVEVSVEHSEESATNGRGFNVETGIADAASAAPVESAYDDQPLRWFAGSAVLLAALVAAAAYRRQPVSAK